MTWNPDYNPPTAQRTSKPLPRLASETTADNPWPVSLLSEKFYTAVERWPSVWVAGQITQINTRRQGSAYITLRDDYQDIALEVNGFGQFAAAATPFVQGDRVIIHGKPNLWMKRTSLSLRGDAIIAAGAVVTRDVAPYLVDRYSERKESAEALSRRVDQAAI